MKRSLLTLSVVLAAALSGPQLVVAQDVWYSGGGSGSNIGMFYGRSVGQPLRGQTTGIFGNQTLGMPLRGSTPTIFGVRTLGEPVAPFTNRFGAGAPVSLDNLPPDFGLPAISPPLAPQVTPAVMPPAAPPAAPTPAPQPNAEAAAPANQPATGEATGQEGANQPTAASPPAYPFVTVPRERTAAGFVPVAAQSFARSPQLSNRLTRIARDRHMLTGETIDVQLKQSHRDGAGCRAYGGRPGPIGQRGRTGAGSAVRR